LPLADDQADVLGDEQFAYLLEGQNQGLPVARRAVSLAVAMSGSLSQLVPVVARRPVRSGITMLGCPHPTG
jgi:hypothetical protein